MTKDRQTDNQERLIDPAKERIFGLRDCRQIDDNLSDWQVRRWINRGISCVRGLALLDYGWLPQGKGTSLEAYHRFLAAIARLGGPRPKGRRATKAKYMEVQDDDRTT